LMTAQRAAMRPLYSAKEFHPDKNPDRIDQRLERLRSAGGHD
jgi:hypothetical protein